MRLNNGGGTLDGDRLDNVRVQSALHQKFYGEAFGGGGDEFALLLGEDFDEFVADDFALLFWVGDAGEFGEEAFLRVDADDVEAEAFAEQAQSFFELVAAQEAGIDEDVDEAVAHGAVNERGGDGGIDSSAEGADGAGAFGLLADGIDGGGDEAGAISSFPLAPHTSKIKFLRMSVPRSV